MTGGDYLTQLGIAVLDGGGKGQGQIQLIWSEYSLLDPSPPHSHILSQTSFLVDVQLCKPRLQGQQTSCKVRIPF